MSSYHSIKFNFERSISQLIDYIGYLTNSQPQAKNLNEIK